MPTYHHNGYTISTSKRKLNVARVHQMLSDEAYWARGRTREAVARSIKHSLCFGVYQGDEMVGFARIITDYTTHVYLCDVLITEAHRGRGLGKWLMACILKHPELQTVYRWFLLTRDAHGLYEQFGFHNAEDPTRYMERVVKK